MEDFGRTNIHVYFEHRDNSTGSWAYCGPRFNEKPFNIAFAASLDLADFINEKYIDPVRKEFDGEFSMPDDVSREVAIAMRDCDNVCCIPVDRLEEVACFVTEELYNCGPLTDEELERIEDEFTFQYLDGYFDFYMSNFMNVDDFKNFRVIFGTAAYEY